MIKDMTYLKIFSYNKENDLQQGVSLNIDWLNHM